MTQTKTSPDGEVDLLARVDRSRSRDGIGRRVWTSSRRVRPVLAVDIVLILVFAVTQPVFLHHDNLMNLLVGMSMMAIIAVGETFVLLSGGADLSVAAVAALSGFMMGRLLESGLPSPVALLAALVLGAALGAMVNGFIIGVLRLSFLVTTLASMTAFTGAVYLWSDTQSITIQDGFLEQLTRFSVLGVPNTVWIMVVVFLVAAYIQNFTMFGRDIYAVGGSYAAARLSGVRTERVIIGVYGWVGLCSAVAGVLLAGQIGVSSPSVDPNLPLMAIAAVLLGGASLAGGAGGVGGTALGVVFLGVLQNGLGLAGIPSSWQQVLTGLILVIAVLGDRFSDRALRLSLLGRFGAPNRSDSR